TTPNTSNDRLVISTSMSRYTLRSSNFVNLSKAPTAPGDARLVPPDRSAIRRGDEATSTAVLFRTFSPTTTALPALAPHERTASAPPARPFPLPHGSCSPMLRCATRSRVAAKADSLLRRGSIARHKAYGLRRRRPQGRSFPAANQ